MGRTETNQQLGPTDGPSPASRAPQARAPVGFAEGEMSSPAQKDDSHFTQANAACSQTQPLSATPRGHGPGPGPGASEVQVWGTVRTAGPLRRARLYHPHFPGHSLLRGPSHSSSVHRSGNSRPGSLRPCPGLCPGSGWQPADRPRGSTKLVPMDAWRCHSRKQRFQGAQ